MMKKVIVFLCMLAFPLNVLAYSSNVILGGNTIGIDIKTKGILVIGFYKVDGKFIKSDLKEGDTIIKVNNIDVNSVNELTKAIEENIKNNKVLITYIHEGKEKTTELDLIEIGGLYKTGLYVKDTIAGIGTLTFIDPGTKRYGALGHEIISANTIVEVRSGSIFKNEITSIDKSYDGTPGSKNAKFYYKTTYGDIKKNTKYGIYGEYTDNYNESNIIEVAKKDEIKKGEATIYTVLNGEEIKEYKINILKINNKSLVKNLYFEITDESLLKESGGIVQGMSGSPIVQNGKLIGAVTHVITDDVKTGYGIFITTMLEESEE